jgi:hypothetical protein
MQFLNNIIKKYNDFENIWWEKVTLFTLKTFNPLSFIKKKKNWRQKKQLFMEATKQKQNQKSFLKWMKVHLEKLLRKTKTNKKHK